MSGTRRTHHIDGLGTWGCPDSTKRARIARCGACEGARAFLSLCRLRVCVVQVKPKLVTAILGVGTQFFYLDQCKYIT